MVVFVLEEVSIKGDYLNVIRGLFDMKILTGKKVFLVLFSIFYVFSNGEKSYAAGNAPGVYITPEHSESSNIVMTDWSATESTPYTYWAVHNWNQGGEGGGYAGFQQQNNVRTVHFAIWDPITSSEPIVAEYLDSNSTATKFGGEGTGLKVSTVYPWNINQWYTMLMRSWTENSHTKVGQWVKDSSGNWKQIAILDYPVANINFRYGKTLFQEDWMGTGTKKRSFKIKNGYERAISTNKWISWDTQKIQNQHGSNQNWNGGATNEYFWAQAGGNENSSIGSGSTFKINQPKTPTMGEIQIDSFTIANVKGKTSFEWKLKKGSSPQFNASIKINRGGETVNVINSISSYENRVD